MTDEYMMLKNMNILLFETAFTNFHFSPKLTAKVIFQEAQKNNSENAPFCPRALRPSSHRQWNAFIIIFIFKKKNSLSSLC